MRTYETPTRRSICFATGLVLILALWPTALSMAQPANAQGKISRNFYRIPYADGLQVLMGRDYVDHGNTPAGDVGPMDMSGESGGPPFYLVAAADGEVIFVEDSRSDCGCDSQYGACANSVRIRHANGEMAAYVHLQQNSATNAGMAPGVLVSQGDVIGIEGDVGWTCGDGRAPTAGTCLSSVPTGAGNCAPHLHWLVWRESTSERVNPMTCGIANNIYVDDQMYTAAACDPPTYCLGSQNISGQTYDGFGSFHVVQTYESITADTLVVQNYASVVLHAADSVRLLPGFRAGEGNSYFRAEIGPCDTTAFAP